ncbi:uncharacterized protein LOC107272826 isoform X5 [Cephus cinctus]|uniref:Uncharacterized protein LOC107272826 isoform X5 n=1 Tax=Cephus cinctus TaxID=211228 RepID=A0AAJ7CB41_CEPCN|nr:uncharacterized protein LOC107272826 isoform X5 [Cephus cinctus]XP_015605847.1 uncharacterized protein LOC107272826 isoform X5 [Cephus cinctus]
MKMAKDESGDLLPDKDATKSFYAKYEPKEIMGRFIALSNSSSILFISLLEKNLKRFRQQWKEEDRR